MYSKRVSMKRKKNLFAYNEHVHYYILYNIPSYTQIKATKTSKNNVFDINAPGTHTHTNTHSLIVQRYLNRRMLDHKQQQQQKLERRKKNS